ncbi:MAG: AsnC family transcriptional regulator [Candidatus Omnitrophica bacterium CG07_land_8_20_14_0_80_42_15]|uniref:AsnC family transcriptional regulator n=1 Tax=Candidatus Aquitaenariimonas noxiae TaxID=1974741 RepID=A0A2J0KVS9_9BACT|nr:MAG: AsnC family transcriptional regulator [Candidatus Omnitrophica bacterium CG07_land_8_20_14_0_80_42_15]
MKLSTKSRYGVRAMVDLAFNYKHGPVAVGDISRREGISTCYLEQILNKLRRHNLVKSVRGPKGGYVLAKSPDNIKIADIVKTLEGNIAPVNCTTVNNRLCNRIDRCVTKLLWDKLASSIENVLNSATLASLLKEAKDAGIDKKIKHEYTFYI